MARKTVLVCDKCGAEVEEGKGAVMRVTFNDARRGAKAADLCDPCAGSMPGHAVARRGPQAEVAGLSRLAGVRARCARPAAARTGLSRGFLARSVVVPRAEGVREPPDYHAPVGLSLVVGPAHAGKVACCSTGSSTRSIGIPG